MIRKILNLDNEQRESANVARLWTPFFLQPPDLHQATPPSPHTKAPEYTYSTKHHSFSHLDVS